MNMRAQKLIGCNREKMKRIGISALLFFLIQFCYAQLYGTFKPIGQVILFADSLRTKKNIDWSINKIKSNISIKVNPFDYYNLAICYVAKGKSDSVIVYLNKSISSFSECNKLILSDTDFDYLHGDICWSGISDRIDSAFVSKNKTVRDKLLAVELFHMGLVDQRNRGFGLKRKLNGLMRLDSINRKRIEKLIDQNGWPTYSMVGKDAADGAFLIIQHADLKMQEKYLDMMIQAVKENEASRESVAMLHDRISIDKFGVQIYGTQVFRRKDKITGVIGKYEYFPIKDVKNVESLRKEMGLIPLKDYLAYFGINY